MKARPCQTSAKRTSRSKSPRRRLRVQLLARARRSVRLWTTAAVDGQNKGHTKALDRPSDPNGTTLRASYGAHGR
jgi:hypothetical protein